jgi:transposase
MSHRAPIFWVGLDVHKDSVTAPSSGGASPEPMRVDRIPNDHKKLRRYFERLQATASRVPATRPPAPATCFSALLTEWGVPCELAAPSLIPRRPGEHRKTDRRDAIKIARDFRDDRLVLIHIPTEEDERVRDLVRCRETFQREIIKSRHYILKFLAAAASSIATARTGPPAHELDPSGAPARHPRRGGPRRARRVLALLEYKLQRRDELDRRIEALALTPRYKPVVDRIGCFRGFKTQAAMVLATELGDVRRFESPRQLMAYLGLVPSEHSSGDRRRLGAITKAGNTRVRHVLVQAAWHYRKRPAVGPPLRRVSRARIRPSSPRLEVPAPPLQALHRLAAKKPKQVAATAVAREMVGFLWAVLRDSTSPNSSTRR